MDQHHQIAPMSLTRAAASGSIEEVRRSIMSGERVNAADARRQTALMIAARMGRVTLVEFLISQGANLNLWDEYRESALHKATQSETLEVVRALVESGAIVDWRDCRFKTPLMIASENGSLDIVKYLIAHSADVNLVDRTNQSALHHAVRCDRCDIVKVLGEAGARVGNDNNQPLWIATEMNKLEIVQFLISNGANVNSVDMTYRRSSLHKAVICNNIDIVNVLIQSGACIDIPDKCGQTPLMFAAERGHLEIMKYLISHGADVNLTNAHCESPLCFVKSIVKLLVESGASVDCVDENGETPLMVAAKRGLLDILDFLISKGADINKQDPMGNSPLLVAIMRCQEKAAMVLIHKGADTNCINSNGKAPITIAAERGLETVVKALVYQGANVNISDSRCTALMYATKTDDLEVMRCLLNAGANVNTEDSTKSTALFVARSVRTVSLLLEHGALVNHQNIHGQTALMSTSGHFDADVARVLIDAGAQVCHLDKTNSTSPLSLVYKTIKMFHFDFKAFPAMFRWFLILIQAGAPKMLKPFHCPIPLAAFIIYNQGQLVKAWVRNGGAPMNICIQCLRKDRFCNKRFHHKRVPRFQVTSLSPLALALICGRISMARYFVSVSFLTWDDITSLKKSIQNNESLASIFPIESRMFLRDEFLCDVPSLFQLSFTTVSAHVKWDWDRHAAVRGTGLPNLLQEYLLFGQDNEEIDLDVREGRERGVLYLDLQDYFVGLNA